MRQCWAERPEDRPTCAEIVARLHDMFIEAHRIMSASRSLKPSGDLERACSE